MHARVSSCTHIHTHTNTRKHTHTRAHTHSPWRGLSLHTDSTNLFSELSLSPSLLSTHIHTLFFFSQALALTFAFNLAFDLALDLVLDLAFVLAPSTYAQILINTYLYSGSNTRHSSIMLWLTDFFGTEKTDCVDASERKRNSQWASVENTTIRNITTHATTITLTAFKLSCSRSCRHCRSL